MVKIIKWKEKNDINLYLVGDVHVGAKTCDIDAFYKTVAMIKKDPRARVILMGDQGEYIFHDDRRRFDINNIDTNYDTVTKQTQFIIDAFMPIKKKVIGVLRGNHEASHAKKHADQYLNVDYRDEAEKTAMALDTSFLEDLSAVELTVGKHKYNIVVAHGCGSSTKLSGQINKLTSIIAGFDIVPDICCIGHVHVLQSIVNTKMDFEFKTKIKYLGFTGTYYRTYIEGNINYGSSNLYSPIPIGCLMYSLSKSGDIDDNKILFD